MKKKSQGIKFLLFSFKNEELMDSIFSQGAGMEHGTWNVKFLQIQTAGNWEMGNVRFPHVKFQKKNVENVHYPVSK